MRYTHCTEEPIKRKIETNLRSLRHVSINSNYAVDLISALNLNANPQQRLTYRKTKADLKKAKTKQKLNTKKHKTVNNNINTNAMSKRKAYALKREIVLQIKSIPAKYCLRIKCKNTDAFI